MGLWVDAAGCTNACRHCYADGHPPYGSFYSLDELHRIVAEWGHICIMCEPTVHSEFPEIMDPQLTGIGNMGFLPTNGFGLAKREDCTAVFARLREFGIHSVSVTLHGLEAHHQHFVGGREGAFQAIMSACRKAVAAGFGINCNVFLDRDNLGDMPSLLAMLNREFGVTPKVGVPGHRVGRRLYRYEKLRPSQAQGQGFLESCSGLKWSGSIRTSPLEQLTEAAWLEAWKRQPDGDDFKDHLEWPLRASVKGVELHLDAKRQVYFAPPSGEWVHLGAFSEGKAAILEHLTRLAPSPHSQMRPEEARLPKADASLVHTSGASVRAKAISTALFAGEPDA
jgi:hypothetical protein